MDIKEFPRDSSTDTNSVTVSETAKRQIVAEVLKSDAHLSEARMGPSFLDGFPETFPDGPIQ